MILTCYNIYIIIKEPKSWLNQKVQNPAAQQ